MCPHDSWEVLIFEPGEWQEDVTYSTITNTRTGQTVRGMPFYYPGHNDICRCLDCGIVATKRGTFS